MKPIYIAFAIVTIMAMVKIASAQTTNIETDIGTISKDANRILISKDLKVLFDIQRPNTEFIPIGNISKTREWGYTTAAWDYVKGDVELIEEQYICTRDTLKRKTLAENKDMKLTVNTGMCLKYPINYTYIGIGENQRGISNINITKLKDGYNISYPRNYDPEYINFSGTPGATCYIQTDYYNVTLLEGTIQLYYSKYNWSRNYGANVTTASNNGIGAIFNAAGSAYLTPTTDNDCVNTTGTEVIKLDCNNTVSPYHTHNNWTFHRTYINLTTWVNTTYRVYHYAKFNKSSPVGYNVTVTNGTLVRHSAPTYVDWDSVTGNLAQNYTNDPNGLFILYNGTLRSDVNYGYGTSVGAFNDFHAWAIGRTTAITSNTRMYSLIKILPLNLSSSGDNKLLDPLKCFRSNVLCNDTVESEPPASTCTWEPGADWIMTDYCNITTSTDICPYRLVVNGTGKLNISNGAIINASLFQFYPATAGWRVHIKSGGFKKC